jgi:hypothetical protein
MKINNLKRVSSITMLSLLLIIVILLATGTGAMYMSPMQVLAILLAKAGIQLPVPYEENMPGVLWMIRLPRVVLGVLIGAGLGVAGASLQGLPGNIEIHTGPVQRILEIPNWINVMDENFNLHLKTDTIAQTWVVEKPSVDGIVTSVEVFDAAGEMIVQFFGKRKLGSPELQEWRALAAAL